MSRPKKIHPPLKGDFNSILKAVAAGTGNVKGPVQGQNAPTKSPNPAKPRKPKK